MSSGSMNSTGRIAGSLLAALVGVAFIACIAAAVVKCCGKREAAEQEEQEQQPEATNPQPALPDNGNGLVQPYGSLFDESEAAVVMPNTSPQPGMTPLGMGNGNPFAPPLPMQQPGNYVYGTPMGVSPPQHANDYGNGMYYSRGTEAQVAAAAPSQRASSTLSSKSDTAVTYFKN